MEAPDLSANGGKRPHVVVPVSRQESLVDLPLIIDVCVHLIPGSGLSYVDKYVDARYGSIEEKSALLLG